MLAAWPVRDKGIGNTMRSVSSISSSRKRAVALVLAAATMFAGAGVVAADQASAIGGNCTSSKGKNDRGVLPDSFYVNASCSSLQGDSKARGTLDVVAGSDPHTAWFTTLNKTYKSGNAAPPIRGTRVEVAGI